MASQSPFQDIAIAVTGDTGLALSRYPVVRGATVSIYATSADNLVAAIAGIEKDIPKARNHIMSTVVDIGKLENVKAWIDTTVERSGKLNGAVNVAVSIANIVMDAFILLLPLLIIVPLQMAPRQKASLILLFAIGGFAHNVCGFIWCFVGVNAGIVCASVPVIKPFFMHYLPSIIVSRLSSNRGDGSQQSCTLDPVVTQNLERRRMQDESYVLSSRDDRSKSDAKSGVEDSEEDKLWNGYHKNARAATGA
ncbi:hypothetical protein QIS74_05984 [Colletotrichum tabaci]|uniref:Rhodopsin domain-containing protein n=1 Tax=Colletotrichum tabaci TaxID=1209068 RepID=A0AAV9THY7_9PEZI